VSRSHRDMFRKNFMKLPMVDKFTRRSLFARLTAMAICLVSSDMALLHAGAGKREPQALPVLRVSAAADLQSAMPELVTEFERKNIATLQVSYGSSGNFFTQIQNGAPFDLFFSADSEYVKKLDATGLSEPGTSGIYAIGRLVVWTRADAAVDVRRDGWQALLDSRVEKIAIANPAHAPYGKAAEAALRSAGIYDQVKSKLVFGENISQTAQFVQSGNAQLGLVALSLAVSPAMKDGHRWEVPVDAYAPIEQSAVVLRSSKNVAAARAFLHFVRGEPGREILRKYGFSFAAAKN
jgi:molybdate transport system substrate-binding protein